MFSQFSEISSRLINADKACSQDSPHKHRVSGKVAFFFEKKLFMRAYAREEIKVEHLPPFCLLTYLIELQIAFPFGQRRWFA